MNWTEKKAARLAHLAAQPAPSAVTAQVLVARFCQALRQADSDPRRHDPENERALVGAKMANLRNGQRAAPMGAAGNPVISIERAAELSGVII